MFASSLNRSCGSCGWLITFLFTGSFAVRSTLCESFCSHHNKPGVTALSTAGGQCQQFLRIAWPAFCVVECFLADFISRFFVFLTICGRKKKSYHGSSLYSLSTANTIYSVHPSADSNSTTGCSSRKAGSSYPYSPANILSSFICSPYFLPPVQQCRVYVPLRRLAHLLRQAVQHHYWMKLLPPVELPTVSAVQGYQSSSAPCACPEVPERSRRRNPQI